MHIICIAGQAQHGKDTLADCLTQIFASKGLRTLTVHHADYLKFICKQYFGWDGNKDEKGRTILQHIGTDIVRGKNPDFWVEVLQKFIEMFQDDYDYILIADCRFIGECDSYKEKYKTTTVKIVRPNFDNGLTIEQKNHPSETGLNNYSFDVTLTCSSGIENIMSSAETFVGEVIGI